MTTVFAWCLVCRELAVMDFGKLCPSFPDVRTVGWGLGLDRWAKFPVAPSNKATGPKQAVWDIFFFVPRLICTGPPLVLPCIRNVPMACEVNYSSLLIIENQTTNRPVISLRLSLPLLFHSVALPETPRIASLNVMCFIDLYIHINIYIYIKRKNMHLTYSLESVFQREVFCVCVCKCFLFWLVWLSFPHSPLHSAASPL